MKRWTSILTEGKQVIFQTTGGKLKNNIILNNSDRGIKVRLLIITSIYTSCCTESMGFQYPYCLLRSIPICYNDNLGKRENFIWGCPEALLGRGPDGLCLPHKTQGFAVLCQSQISASQSIPLPGLGAGSLPVQPRWDGATSAARPTAASPCQGCGSTAQCTREAAQSNFSVTYTSLKAAEKYLSKQISNAETLHKCWKKYFLRLFFSNWRETVISLFICHFLRWILYPIYQLELQMHPPGFFG